MRNGSMNMEISSQIATLLQQAQKISKDCINRCKDDTESFKFTKNLKLIVKPAGKLHDDHLTKSFCSADDAEEVQNYEKEAKIPVECKLKTAESMFITDKLRFNTINEADQELDSTQRQTQQKEVEKEREEEIKIINHDLPLGQENQHSIHKSDLEEKENHKEKLNGIIRMHDDNPEQNKEEHYHVMFADEAVDQKRHSLITTYYVESYKRYNATSCMDGCRCTIF